MTVTTYNPKTQLPVSFTEKAIRHLTNQVKARKAEGIEFNVKESGCSGFKYLLELTLEVKPEFLEYPLSDDLRLFVAPKVVPLISGTQVDYIQEGVNFRLDFNNPNATALCGCGESFSVE